MWRSLARSVEPGCFSSSCSHSRQRFGPVERKDLATAGVRVQQAGESGFDAGALIQERQWTTRDGNVVWNALAVLLRLNLDAGERLAFSLGLDHAGGCAVHEEKVVGLAVPLLHGKFADSNTPASRDVGGVAVLDYPSGGVQKLVNVLAGPILGGDGHGKSEL